MQPLPPSQCKGCMDRIRQHTRGRGASNNPSPHQVISCCFILQGRELEGGQGWWYACIYAWCQVGTHMDGQCKIEANKLNVLYIHALRTRHVLLTYDRSMSCIPMQHLFVCPILPLLVAIISRGMKKIQQSPVEDEMGLYASKQTTLYCCCWWHTFVV
jgi:hypothetical protein